MDVTAVVAAIVGAGAAIALIGEAGAIQVIAVRMWKRIRGAA